MGPPATDYLNMAPAPTPGTYCLFGRMGIGPLRGSWTTIRKLEIRTAARQCCVYFTSTICVCCADFALLTARERGNKCGGTIYGGFGEIRTPNPEGVTF